MVWLGVLTPNFHTFIININEIGNMARLLRRDCPEVTGAAYREQVHRHLIALQRLTKESPCKTFKRAVSSVLQ